MKSLRLFAIIAALTVCGTMSAQSINTVNASYARYSYSATGTSLGVHLSGVSVGVSLANPLSKDLPLLYEYGANLMYATNNVAGTRTTFVSAIVPFNLMWRFDVDNLMILPFAGLNVTGHIIGNCKDTDDYGNSESYSLFGDDEYGDGANRFQLGAQVGAKAIIASKYMLGVTYSPYLTKLEEGTSSNLLLISLGLVF